MYEKSCDINPGIKYFSVFFNVRRIKLHGVYFSEIIISNLALLDKSI